MRRSCTPLMNGDGAIVEGIMFISMAAKSFAFSLGKAVLHRIEADIC